MPHQARGLQASEARPGWRGSTGHMPEGWQQVWRVTGLCSCPQHQVMQKVSDLDRGARRPEGQGTCWGREAARGLVSRGSLVP